MGTLKLSSLAMSRKNMKFKFLISCVDSITFAACKLSWIFSRGFQQATSTFHIIRNNNIIWNKLAWFLRISPNCSTDVSVFSRWPSLYESPLFGSFTNFLAGKLNFKTFSLYRYYCNSESNWESGDAMLFVSRILLSIFGRRESLLCISCG